jgi:hypothetical protein
MISLRHAVLRVVSDASEAVSTCKISRCMHDISELFGFTNLYETVSVLYHLLRRSSGAVVSPEDIPDLPERFRVLVCSLPVKCIPELADLRRLSGSSKVGQTKRNNMVRLVRVSIQNNQSLWVRSIKKRRAA